MSNCLIFDENYARSDRYVSLSASSEQATFPATNAAELERRARVWKTEGFFDFNAADNTNEFNFLEDGVLKTATFTGSDSVSNINTLTSNLNSALDAAATNVTFGVSYNTTSKSFSMLITLNGATSFEITDNSGWDEALGITTPTGLITSNVVVSSDEIRIHHYETLTFQYSVPFNFDGCFIFGERNKTFPISQTASAFIEANTADSWSSPAFTTSLDINEYSAGKSSSTGLASTGYEYWRLKIYDPTNPNLSLNIGGIYLGFRLNLARAPISYPFVARDQDRSFIAQSQAGQKYGTNGQINQTFEFSIDLSLPADKEILENHYQYHQQLKAFVVDFDPLNTISDATGLMRKLVFYDSEPTYSVANQPNYYDISLSMSEVL